MTEDLINVYKNSKKLMPLVHLPVQSGSNKILEFMNRKHTIEKYLKIYNKLKKINPKIEFSSDFIIAYPGEDESDLNNTLKLINKIKFINSFSFIFSPRPGTAASNLPLIDKKKSLERLEIIQQKLFNNQIKMNKSLENTTINVLVENRMDDKSKLFGRSEYMTSVLFGGSNDLIGKIVKVKILNSNKNTLFGEIVDQTNKKVA
jgi:tRNA-2-methylthio-N6-dimethylallyladenosine synthase